MGRLRPPPTRCAYRRWRTRRPSSSAARISNATGKARRPSIWNRLERRCASSCPTPSRRAITSSSSSDWACRCISTGAPTAASAAPRRCSASRSRAPTSADRDRVFEWWAGALDREAQFGPEAERGVIYRRILDRAEAELARNDRSPSASYWLAAAARGVGDLERAWGASIAGWVRARGLGPRGDALRADLDRFVTQVLLARARAPVVSGRRRPSRPPDADATVGRD